MNEGNYSDCVYTDKTRTVQQGFKLPKKPFASLSIAHCESIVAFWNKFELFIFCNSNFTESRNITVIEPSFQVDHLFIGKDIIIAIDSQETIYRLPILASTSKQRFTKLKANVEEIFFSSYQINDNTAVTLTKFSSIYIRLNIHKICSHFEKIQSCNLQFANELDRNNDIQAHCVYVKGYLCCSDNNELTDYFSKTFTLQYELYLIFYSLDRRKVFANIIAVKNKFYSCEPKEIYNCPSEFNDIYFLEKHRKILIILKSGTLLYIDIGKEQGLETIHLCSAALKTLLHGDTLYFTDYINLWKLRNVCDSSEGSFEKLSVKLPYNMLINNNILFCISYSNIIYMVDIQSGARETQDSDVCLGLRDVTSSKSIIKQLIKEVEKKDRIDIQIETEKNKLTAISLPTRRTSLEKFIEFKYKVFTNFEDALKETDSLVLIEDCKEYLTDDVDIILVNFSIKGKLQRHMFEIAKTLKEQMRLQVTVRNAISITYSFPFFDKIHHGMNILIAVPKVRNNIHRDIKFQVVIPIKNVVDKAMFWSILYSKNVTIGTENFIMVNSGKLHNNTLEMLSNKPLQVEKINEIAMQYGGFVVNLKDGPCKHKRMFKMFLKLPKNYRDILSEKSFPRNFTSCRSKYLKDTLSNVANSNQTSEILLQNGDKIKLNIDIIYETTYMVISSSNIMYCLDFREFLAKEMFDKKCVDTECRAVAQLEYTKIENLRRKLREALEKSNEETIHDVHIQFQKICANFLV